MVILPSSGDKYVNMTIIELQNLAVWTFPATFVADSSHRVY